MQQEQSQAGVHAVYQAVHEMTFSEDLPIRAVDPAAPVIPAGADGQITTVSIDGFLIPQLTTAVHARVREDGSIVEHVHRAVVHLGDGTLTDNIFETDFCDVCAQSAIERVLEGVLTIAMAILAARCRRGSAIRSALSQRLLCPKHQATFLCDDGVAVIMSYAEAEHLAMMQRPSPRLW